MESSLHILEKKLQELWKLQKLNSRLKTLEGEEIQVIYPGDLNKENAGPDFTNARIKIGNFLYTGDVEIDVDYNNWKTHGHNINSKHNKVILHVCLKNAHNQLYVYSKDGRRIVSVCIKPYISSEIYSELSQPIEDEHEQNFTKCHYVADVIDFEIKKKFISSLGINRFDQKSEKIFRRLKELAYIKTLKLNEPVIRYEMHPDFEKKEFFKTDFINKDLWEQVFYEKIFEALGYSKNKNEMMKLAQYANLDFLRKFNNDKNSLNLIESSLFNISGLIHKAENIDNEYLKSIHENWKYIQKIYDGETMRESEWQFMRMRPQNFPTIRIAGGAQIAHAIIHENLIANISKKISEIHNFNVLAKSLRSLFIIRAKGYWKNHFVFNNQGNSEIRYFVGISRADEIIVNVVLPFFYLYFNVFDKKETSKKILKFYSNYFLTSENRIITEVAESLQVKDLLKKSIYAQGLLELFRNYCAKKKCDECEIGKSVFN